jgi:hypothetical protein
VKAHALAGLAAAISRASGEILQSAVRLAAT